ncbi:glycosyltransferase family 2 protein [Robiginitalea aurantiaca]|uniref:Glycosyltransferase family 2 protein n=1 Tax=Robiginitalea aurantiaca TaxID=3056915 RepID=A0ABT7WDQ4_9FLAO|nr:glycosyltransferase family 2 protein [Robiginitalea aurantiaca]MDM9631048.1 glycosyltransferase family 2 protein [Robiginitalea aurantiaca]
MHDNPHIQAPIPKEQWVIRILILLGVLSILNFLYWFFQPAFRGHPVLYGMLCVVFGYGMLRHLYLWYHYAAIKVPKTPAVTPEVSIDVLTTYFPGEPIEMVEKTLRAIKDITYPHTAYLCDEANDPYLRNLCEQLGVRHVTRLTRKDAKAGNINNALRQASGQICLILDPDHIPQPDILDHILPQFSDPEVGFVQIVQSYHNRKSSLVARGAAEQTYQFYGPMMMSMNSYGTVNAIGANCTFRRSALDSIGGHAPGLAEDMHTAMQLYAKGWKSVYVPKVLARGQVPETLLTHFKQQLKWSRGTFDLLFRVYPRLFPKFTWRQKLHFGLLPLHFLIGLIYLLSFCIPVASLIFSISPWTGNILIFLLAITPVALSTLLIRAYIQKWVIERTERGFHLAGGLLQISTWWIHFLGFVYSIINKEVPYLPTEKKEIQVTNLQIVIPNILVGLVSVFAIVYGLSRDLTPFSIMMAGFAALNASFMFFSLYLATGVTNNSRIFKEHLPQFIQEIGVSIKSIYRKISRFVFTWARKGALPVLLLGTLTTAFLIDQYVYSQWEGITAKLPSPRKGPDYSGIFYPTEPNGLSSMEAIGNLENDLEQKFDLISLYLAWGDGPSNEVPQDLIQDIYKSGALPMITWEPWMNDFRASDSIPEMNENKGVFKKILSGQFDGYIDRFAERLKSFNAPVFLRFAHEFDNPSYPWSSSGGNSPQEFRQAWQYVYDRFSAQSAFNVIWVWNPLYPLNVEMYFPGNAYMDWIGVTSLNYGTLNQDGQWRGFKTLYEPFEKAFEKLPDLPVMLAEFGSLNLGGNRDLWFSEALSTSDQTYPRIKARVFFNSKWDQNIPLGTNYGNTYLDWTVSPESLQLLQKADPLEEGSYTQIPIVEKDNAYTPLPFPNNQIRGVRYKKGQRWFSSHYVLDRPTLEKDFRELKNIGVNTIRVDDPEVYSYNLLRIAAEQGLQLIYSFRIPDTLDFREDQVALQELREKIIKIIKRYKDQSHISAWNLGNPVWDNLGKRFARPALDLQRSAFLVWFEDLCDEIKNIDPQRRLFADFSISQGSEEYIHRVKNRKIPIDALGLMIRDSADISTFKRINSRQEISYYIADSKVEDLKNLEESHVVIRNWQDQWEAHHVTFDGLVDHRGQKKPSYYTLRAHWTDMTFEVVPVSISILRPAFILLPGDKRVFTALKYENGSWQNPTEAEAENFEWILVKRGHFGEPIGLKPLRRGSQLELEIPEEYMSYQLLLTYKEKNTDKPVISVRKSLNLPLYPSN